MDSNTSHIRINVAKSWGKKLQLISLYEDGLEFIIELQKVMNRTISILKIDYLIISNDFNNPLKSLRK